MPLDDVTSPADRCDRGDAGGQVKLSKWTADGPLHLWLCKHHFERHEAPLVLDGWRIVRDNRPALAVKP
jgi:hypothetical protein